MKDVRLKVMLKQLSNFNYMQLDIKALSNTFFKEEVEADKKPKISVLRFNELLCKHCKDWESSTRFANFVENNIIIDIENEKLENYGTKESFSSFFTHYNQSICSLNFQYLVVNAEEVCEFMAKFKF